MSLLLVSIGVAVALIALLLIVPAGTPRIDRRRHPNGLAVLEPVSVNGTRQWVLIRAEDLDRPVVLFVHGGPGTSMLGLMRRSTRPLEPHFIVVNWDQRGAGKSFAAGRDRAGMRMEQFVDDIIALSTHLARRFRKDRILLVGHSWGTTIGLLAVARRPDLFSGYVGIGQGSRMAESELLSYRWTLQQAQEAGNTAAIRRLTAIGPPPYSGPDWRAKFLTERMFLAKFGGEYHGSTAGALGVVLKQLLLSREYTLADRIHYFRGITRSVDALIPELVQTDLFTAVPEVRVPVYLCLGRHDHEVPSALAARYFDALRAPQKRLIWFEHSAHLPNIEERDKFNRLMIDTVLPAITR